MTTTVDIALTGKGQRYAAEMSAVADTTTTVDTGQKSNAFDILTLQVDRTSRKALATSIEALIDMLDDISPDPDLEETADDEPSLGWTSNGPQATSNLFLDGRGSAYDDREEENEHGGDINDEPQAGADGRTWEDDEHSLGWTVTASLTGDLKCFGSEGDLELELGTTEHVDQRKAVILVEGTWNTPDGEPDLGWGNNPGKGYQVGDTGDDRKGDDEREQPDHY